MKVPRILKQFQLKILTLQLRLLIAKDLMSKDGVTTHLMSKDGVTTHQRALIYSDYSSYAQRCVALRPYAP